jgi:hypothetical protein
LLESRVAIVTSLSAGVLDVSVRQFAQPSLEKLPLWFLLGEAKRLFVGDSGFRVAGFPRDGMLDNVL